jgi:hypothetical protein
MIAKKDAAIGSGTRLPVQSLAALIRTRRSTTRPRNDMRSV